MSNAYPSLIESGQRENIGADILAKLAAALGTSIDYLLTGAGGPPSQRRVRAAVKAARDRRDGKVPVLPAELEEKTPAESVVAKRQSSAPPPPERLADATDVNDDTLASDLPSSTPKNLPPVKVSERNDRTDTNPDPNAGDVLPPVKRRLTVLDRDTPVPESD